MTDATSINALELGRAFFEEVVKPVLARLCPELLAQAACGRFGLGSECLGLDDSISRDHHWGPRVDILFPEEVIRGAAHDGLKKVSQHFPADFRGFRLAAGHVGGAGLAPEGLDHFMWRAIGRTTVPGTLAAWLDIPEEDITHVINGEVWYDGPGKFTSIREFFGNYYPDDVWKRRIAHWCRYASGMGLYHIRRAVLRENLPFAFIALGRVIQRTLELAFLLNRTYFPYDKWLYPLFQRLPELASQMDPWIQETVQSTTSWDRRIELIEWMHSVLDEKMVDLGIIAAHPKFVPSETSGYRLLEHAYAELIKASPLEIRTHVPLWDQKYLEEFHSGFVAELPLDEWDTCLNLVSGGDH